MVSITVRLFLNETNEFRLCFQKLLMAFNTGLTWRWGARRRCGCWQVWTSRWVTWPLLAAGGGCTHTVWLSLQQILNYFLLETSVKQTISLLEANSFLSPNQRPVNSHDFCEPGTLMFLYLCWYWTNFLTATWKVKAENVSTEVRFRHEDCDEGRGDSSPVCQFSWKHRGVGQQCQRENLDVDWDVCRVLQDHLLILWRNRHVQSQTWTILQPRGLQPWSSWPTLLLQV